ncbi:unnamed protein product [Caenorhabditis brenneri]
MRLLVAILCALGSSFSIEIPIFKVHGTLTCFGIPYHGDMLMTGGGYLHSLTNVNDTGKFSLAAELSHGLHDMTLIIEHNCIEWKHREFGSGAEMFSEYPINFLDLILSNYSLERNIELSTLYLEFSLPELYLRKLYYYSRRMLSDNRHRLSTSETLKLIFQTLHRLRKYHLR